MAGRAVCTSQSLAESNCSKAGCVVGKSDVETRETFNNDPIKLNRESATRKAYSIENLRCSIDRNVREATNLATTREPLILGDPQRVFIDAAYMQFARQMKCCIIKILIALNLMPQLMEMRLRKRLTWPRLPIPQLFHD